MNDENRIDPGHGGIRDLCRVVGPIVLGIGILMIIIGIGSFFTAFGGRSAPKYFWRAFVGMPLAAVGGSITRFGFMGRVARYMAGEMAPVAKDTFNYMADGTKDGVETIARSIGEGIGAGVAAAGGLQAKQHTERQRYAASNATTCRQSTRSFATTAAIASKWHDVMKIATLSLP